MGKSPRMWLVLVLTVFSVAAFSGTASARGGAGALGPCSYGTDVLTQKDGKTVVAVFTNGCGAASGHSFNSFIARLNVDGKLDPNFGDGGVVPVGESFTTGLAVRPDGRLLTTGGQTLYGFTADGRPDASIGGDGSVELGLAGPAGPSSTSRIDVAPDGGILIEGRTSPNWGWAIQKLTPKGEVDPAFAGGQPLIPDPTTASGPGPVVIGSGAVTFDEAGNAFIGFSYGPSVYMPDDYETGFGVLKVDPSGDPDPGYGDSGGVGLIGELQGGQASVRAIVRHQDGSVDLYGDDYGNPTAYFADRDAIRAHLGPGGSGAESRTKLKFPDGRSHLIADFSAADGGVFIAPVPSTSPLDPRVPGKLQVVRFGDSEVADSQFGVDGLVGERIGLRSLNSAASANPGGGVTLAGTAMAERCVRPSGLGYCDAATALARYDASGRIDPGFGRGGVVTFPRIHCSLPGPKSEPFACRKGRVARPRVKARFSDRRLSKLVIRVNTSLKRPARARPWTEVRLYLPKPLRLRKSRRNSIRVFAGAGPRGRRIKPAYLTFERNVPRVLRSTVPGGDALRFVIPRSAVRKFGHAIRRRKLGVRVKFDWYYKGKPKTGAARVRIPG